MKEALLSLDQAFPHSPQTTSQEDNLGNNSSISKRSLLNLVNLPFHLMDTQAFLLDQLSSGIERLRLGSDPVYQGKEEPRGDGSKVIIFPGLATIKPSYSGPLRYLSKAGFEPEVYMPHPINAYSWNEILYGSMKRIWEYFKSTRERANVVGHSLGAYMLRVLAEDYPEFLEETVKKIFLLGAPPPERVNILVESVFMLSQWPLRKREIDEIVSRIKNLRGDVNLKGIDVYEIESSHDLIVERRKGEISDNVLRFHSSHSALPRDRDVLSFIANKLVS